MTKEDLKFAYLCYLIGYRDGLKKVDQVDEDQLLDRVSKYIKKWSNKMHSVPVNKVQIIGDIVELECARKNLLREKDMIHAYLEGWECAERLRYINARLNSIGEKIIKLRMQLND